MSKINLERFEIVFWLSMILIYGILAPNLVMYVVCPFFENIGFR